MSDKAIAAAGIVSSGMSDEQLVLAVILAGCMFLCFILAKLNKWLDNRHEAMLLELEELKEEERRLLMKLFNRED